MQGFTETFIKRLRSDAENIIASENIQHSIMSEIVSEVIKPIGGTEYDFSGIRVFIENSNWMRKLKTNNPSLAETVSLDVMSQVVVAAFAHIYIYRAIKRKISDYRVTGNPSCTSQIQQYHLYEIIDFFYPIQTKSAMKMVRELIHGISFSTDEIYGSEDAIEEIVLSVAANVISNKRGSTEDYFVYAVYSDVLDRTGIGEYASQIKELIDVYDIINDITWDDKYGEYSITVEYYASIISDWVKMSVSEAIKGNKREGRLILSDVLDAVKAEMKETKTVA